MSTAPHAPAKPPKMVEAKHPRYPYRVHYTEGGQRKSKFVKSQAAGRRFIKELGKDAAEGGTANPISLSERAAVIDYREHLERAGISMADALQFAVDAFTDPPADPREALAQGFKFYRRAEKSATVTEASREVQEAKERARKSDRYLADLKATLTKFSGSFGDRKLATIEAKEVEEWLHGNWTNATTINSQRARLSVLFSHGQKHGYNRDNPAQKVERVKAVSEEVGTITADQLKALLDAADPEILPAIAIGAFCGLRDAEIKRLTWEDVMAENVRVTAGSAKTAARRIVPIPKCAQAWIGKRDGEGKVWPRNGRKLHEAARRAAGFGEPGTETDKEKEDGVKLTPWPSNALRHSYGSNHLAAFGDAAQTALNMGHVDSAMVFAHYRAVIDQEAALDWWEVTP